MILVDASVWIDFLRARETPQTLALKRAWRRLRIATADLVLTEVLQGSRDETMAAAIEQMMTTAKLVIVCDGDVAVQAAKNYRFLRAKGVTIRKTIDTLIATRCIIDDIPLLYSDRDFDPFVAHLGLRSALQGMERL